MWTSRSAFCKVLLKFMEKVAPFKSFYACKINSVIAVAKGMVGFALSV
jgi:hypothetical protein